MKKIFLIIFSTCMVYCISAQPKVSVDERFELTGIVFRLSEYPVFMHSTPENYVADIDAWFNRYREHDLIKFVKKTIDAKPVLEFNYMAYLAADIEITPKGIGYTDRWITEYASENSGEWQAAWSKAELKEYLRLLNRFYKDTKFHQFYTAHRTFYDSAETHMQTWVNQIDTAWFRQFFGQPFEMENIWVVPANGRHNFALDRRDKEGKIYHNCAIGCSSTDADGFPQFNYRNFMTLIHEICHNYNNPVCDLHKNLFKGICDTLYTYVGKDLEDNYYGGWENLLYEGLNRACEYTYYKEHQTLPQEEWERRVRWEELKGFLWLNEMIAYLQAYPLNRKQYRSFAEFVPEIAGFLRQVAADMDSYYLPKRETFFPRVLSTFPANGSVVDTNIDKVVIVFSRPMQNASGFREVKDENVLFVPCKTDSAVLAYLEWKEDTTQPEPDYSKYEKPYYWLNDRTFVLPLAEPLKAQSKYGIGLKHFGDKQFYCAIIPFDLIFETK